MLANPPNACAWLSTQAAQCSIQAFALEPRDIAGQTNWQPDNIFESGGPTLWAPAKVWDALAQNELLIPDMHRPAAVSVSPSAKHLKSPSSARASWVFVPTYNRYQAKPDKQMLLDWADAMPSQHPYVRFIVVRPLPDEILVSICMALVPSHVP